MNITKISNKLIEYEGVIEDCLQDEYFDNQDITPNDLFGIFKDRAKKREFEKIIKFTGFDKGTFSKNLMISALIRSQNIVTQAARKVGITPQTHYNWLESDPEYAKAVKAIDNYTLDFVEGKMYQIINNGDAGTVRWYLSTKGKKRGYGQNPETETSTETNQANLKDTFLSRLLSPNYTTNVFRNLWTFLFSPRHKILISRGGTRSTKSYSSTQTALALTYLFPNTRILICRRTVKLLKKTVMRDSDEIIKAHDLQDDFDFHKTDRILTNNKTGAEIEFCAFATADDAKGVKANFVFMDEAPEMSFGLFQELLLRLDKDAKFILSFNPVDEFSWVNEKVEKNPHRKDVQILVSTYLDNPFLSETQVQEIELLQHTNTQLWKIYGLGEYGRVEGLIFPNWSKCTESEFDNVAGDKIAFGVDWGFNDPTAVVCAKFDSRFNRLYLKEIAYFTKDEKYIETAVSEIKASKYWTRNAPIAIDHKPEALLIMHRNKLNAVNADKGAGSIKGGIDLMNNVEIIIEENSYNLIREFHSYLYAEDKDGNALDKPVDFMNHAIDASRYASTFIFKNYRIDLKIK